MAFIESPRFPDGIALGAVFGPSWLTEVVERDSGHENRNQLWSETRMRGTVPLVAMDDTDRNAVIAFLRAVAKGRVNGFRIKDFLDYEAWYTDSAAGLGICTLVSAGVYQLYKRYTSGGNTVDRIITKLVVGSVGIKAGTTLLTSGVDYTLDTTTGLVTVSGSPTPAPAVWEGRFDVPVRLASDYVGMRALMKGVADVPSLEVIEIRI